jgi:hypothetical protein
MALLVAGIVHSLENMALGSSRARTFCGLLPDQLANGVAA